MQIALDYDNHALKRIFGGFKAYLWLLIGIFSLYLVAFPHVRLLGYSLELNLASTPYDGDSRVMRVMALLLLLALAAALVLILMRKMTAGRLAAFLIAAGLILRFGYMLYTPFYIRGHDVASYDGYGHLDYIYTIFKTLKLPASDWGQFYHPPFSHIASATAVWLYAFFSGIRVPETILEAARIVPCFASCALLIMSIRLFDALDFSKRARNVALSVIAFHPTFILLSASINNDMLMIFFFMAAFLYTVRWYKDPSYKNILLTALFIGCAMSTKFSGALIAVFTAMVFLLVLARRFSEGKLHGLIGQFAAFSAVCFPLGLWYHIRNLALFGQRLGYVAQIPRTSALYVGDRTFAERFLAFSLPDMLRHVFCDPFADYRLWEYTVKCALFGEFMFTQKHQPLARVLIIASLVLIVLSLLSLVYFLFIDKSKNRLAVLSFFTVWALAMLSFFYFNIKYPFGCTMDFRYIVPTVITGAAFLGLLYDKLSERKGARALSGLFIALLGIFCAASAAFFMI